jgi:hypothetical protein
LLFIMGNSHHSKHNGQHNHEQEHGAKSAGGSPIQQQASEQHRFETRDRNLGHSQHPNGGGRPGVQDQHRTSGRADSEKSLIATVLQAIKNNPIPIALVGLGLAAVGITLAVLHTRSESSWLSKVEALAKHLTEEALKTAGRST